MGRRWKRNDFFLVLLVLGLAAAIWLFRQAAYDTKAAFILVKVDGETEGVYDLSVDQTVSINHGSNILVIRDGKADMTDADCPDRLCVKQKAIAYNHENIICLPNKVIVEVESEKETQVDAVTN